MTSIAVAIGLVFMGVGGTLLCAAVLVAVGDYFVRWFAGRKVVAK